MQKDTQTAAGSDAAVRSGGARIRGSGSNSDGPGPDLMTAATLCGNPVVNDADEELGAIEHVMLDVPRGRIAYAVMTSGGILGIGEKRFAIPWSALTLDTDRKCFVLEVAKERIKNAPGFDNDSWPRSADDSWHREVHRYYNMPMWWE